MKRFALATFVALATPALAAEPVTIWRSPGCGCCDAYAEYLQAEGFDVTVIDDVNFDDRSVAAGVPEQGIGCHLAMIDGYVVSGHVPVATVERLLSEKPKIVGITLPGMPQGSPGMSGRKAEPFTTYEIGSQPPRIYSVE